MTDISIPPLRELPPGRLEARKQHLLGEIAPSQGRRLGKPVLVTAILAAALAGAGVAVAAGLGAFNGLSAAQHPRTAADTLGRKTRVDVAKVNAWSAKIEKRARAYDAAHGLPAPPKPERILPDSTRLLGRLPVRGLGNVYAAADNFGNLCIVAEGGGAACTPPLGQSRPAITFEIPWQPGVWEPVGYGVVIDGITAVSFTYHGREVTVPVKDNLWHYVGSNSAGASLTLHLADGTTRRVHPECDGTCDAYREPLDPGNIAGLH